MKAYEAAAEALSKMEVRTLFGLLGDGNIQFAVAARDRGVDYVAARHENSAVAMADTFARVTRSVGVATVTTGPGLTNALTALGEATRARTPLVVFAGATVSTAADYAQLIDQDGVAKVLGCGIQRFRGPQHLGQDLVSAFRRARAERRPVVLSVPVDHQNADIGQPEDITPPLAVPAQLPAAESVREVVDFIHRARRPVILCGWGAYLADAHTELVQLGEAAGAILATTVTAKGFFAGDPFDVGTSGGFASDAAARLLQKADLVLAFGASLNKWTTRSGALYSTATVVQVDQDPSAIGAHLEQVRPVLGDVRLTAGALLDELLARPRTDVGYRTSDVRDAVEKLGPGDPYEDAGTPETIDPRTLTLALGSSLPTNSVVVTDSGAFTGFPGSYLTIQRPGGFLFPQAFQSVGLGLAHTIGAGLARDGDLPVSLIGDGGLFMSLGELETIVRLGRPHLVVVYNDSAYAAEVHIGSHHGIPTDIVRFPDADFAAIARATGGEGRTVRDVEDLAPLDKWLERPSGLLLLDCKVDATIPAPFWGEFFLN